MSTPTPLSPDAQLGDATPPKLSNARLALRLALVLGIIIAVVTLMGPHWTRVMAWGLEDNDDAMRVLEVRDWLNGQGWFDVTQYRLNPPQGGDMHWSRIADLPLAALMAALMAIFGAEMGAKYATFFTPILLGVFYVWLGARTAVKLAGKTAFIPAILIVACAPAALSYFMPGRVDHHGLQMILIVGALYGLFSGGFVPALLSGVAIATGICIGLEALPLQVVLIAWVAARWGLRGEDVRAPTLGFALGFGVALVVLFALTVPSHKWHLPVNDAVGRGYVVLGFSGGALLAGAAFGLSKLPLFGRLAVLAAIGVCVLCGILIFPEIIVPPYGKVDPLLMRLWLNNVNETAPLIDAKLSRVLSFAAFPFLAALCSMVAVYLSKDKERDLWILATMAILVAIGLAILWQVRVAGLATAISGVIAAALVGKCFERFTWRIALGVALVINPVTPTVAAVAIAKFFEPKEGQFLTGGGQGCFTQASFATLRSPDKGLVVAPIDMGARILLTTNKSVLAAPYHRNNTGNLAAYQMFILPPAEAKVRAAALGVDYVAICKRSAEVSILSREGPNGLMSGLNAGKVPDWLTLLPTPKGSDVLVYKVTLP